MSSQIFGNLIGASIITQTSGPSFFLIMGLIMIFCVCCFYFLRKPNKFDGEEEGEHEEHESFMKLM